jgi:hypothetical protein
MYVYVMQDVGNAAAPRGAVVDASGWANLDMLLEGSYVRLATNAEIAAIGATPHPTAPAIEARTPRGRQAEHGR